MGLDNMNKTLLLAAAVTAAAFVTHGATAAPTGNPQTYGTVGTVTIGGAPFGTANGTGGVGEFDDTGGTGGIAAFKTVIATVTDLPALGGGTVTAEIAYDGTFVGTTFTSNGDTTTTFLSCTGDDIICDGVGAIGVPTPGSGGIPFSLDLCLGGTWSTTSLVGGVATLSTDHTSTGSPACAAPDAPTGLSATPGDGQATIDFTPGAANGTAITNYAYRVDGGPSTVLDPPQATGPVTITGLTNGTSYEITLRAINGSGEGGSSAAVNVTPATAPDAPDAPTATAGDSQASVTWTKPANNGGSTITGYTATSAPEDKICTTSGADDVTCDVTGLTNGTPYTFTVKATNALGTSADSTPSSSVTPLGAPDAPTGLLQQGEADNVATIAFTPGADNGAAITNYAYGLDGGSYTALDPAQPTGPVTITGLTNGSPILLRSRQSIARVRVLLPVAR